MAIVTSAPQQPAATTAIDLVRRAIHDRRALWCQAASSAMLSTSATQAGWTPNVIQDTCRSIAALLNHKHTPRHCRPLLAYTMLIVSAKASPSMVSTTYECIGAGGVLSDDLLASANADVLVALAAPNAQASSPISGVQRLNAIIDASWRQWTAEETALSTATLNDLAAWIALAYGKQGVAVFAAAWAITDAEPSIEHQTLTDNIAPMLAGMLAKHDALVDFLRAAENASTSLSLTAAILWHGVSRGHWGAEVVLQALEDAGVSSGVIGDWGRLVVRLAAYSDSRRALREWIDRANRVTADERAGRRDVTEPLSAHAFVKRKIADSPLLRRLMQMMEAFGHASEREASSQFSWFPVSLLPSTDPFLYAYTTRNEQASWRWLIDHLTSGAFTPSQTIATVNAMLSQSEHVLNGDKIDFATWVLPVHFVMEATDAALSARHLPPTVRSALRRRRALFLRTVQNAWKHYVAADPASIGRHRTYLAEALRSIRGDAWHHRFIAKMLCDFSDADINTWQATMDIRTRIARRQEFEGKYAADCLFAMVVSTCRAERASRRRTERLIIPPAAHEDIAAMLADYVKYLRKARRKGGRVWQKQKHRALRLMRLFIASPLWGAATQASPSMRAAFADFRRALPTSSLSAILPADASTAVDIVTAPVSSHEPANLVSWRCLPEHVN